MQIQDELPPPSFSLYSSKRRFSNVLAEINNFSTNELNQSLGAISLDDSINVDNDKYGYLSNCTDDDEHEPTVRMTERTIILDETAELVTLQRHDAADNDNGANGDVIDSQQHNDDYVPYFCDDYYHGFDMEEDNRYGAETSRLFDYSFALPSTSAQTSTVPCEKQKSDVAIQQYFSNENDNNCAYDNNKTMKETTATTTTLVDTAENLLKMSGRVNLADLLTPVRPTKRTAKSLTVQDEFYGVYCLISRSEHKAYKNRCYIGYTVNPNRRIRQHNAGRQFGGAKKTDSRGPWDMVCIIHGFPNSISALRFEWAWQNPDKSKRLRDFESLQRKTRKQTPFEYRLRVACRMLNADPWRRLALTFRWLLPECKIPFPTDIPPPLHVKLAHGVVTKTETVVPLQLNEYSPPRQCQICAKPILQLRHLLRCLNFENCVVHFHARCLAESALTEQGQIYAHLTPLEARCTACFKTFLWGDLVRDQRVLTAVDAAKPLQEGVKIAGGMIPLRFHKK